ACGHTAKENRPTQAKFHCVSCGHNAHADTVGAINVLRAGLARRKAQPA
ncbi:zinc ribbon domain-containing protein, partial [Streptomyces sp. NPDC004044]